MKKSSRIGVSLAVLGMAAMGARSTVPITRPPLDLAYLADSPEAAGARGSSGTIAAWGPEHVENARRELESAFRYKGTTASAGTTAPAGDVSVERICALLEEDDFVPDLRVRRFSAILPDFTVVGWHLRVERVEVREDGTFVRVRSGPLLRKLGEGTIGVLTTYPELYRIADGELQFIDGGPMPDDMTISMAIM